VARVDVSELPAHARDSLDRGEAVEIVRGGEVVARVPGARRPGTLLEALAAFKAWRHEQGISDGEWLDELTAWEVELREVRRQLNRYPDAEQ
jgi:hypothetical protein